LIRISKITLRLLLKANFQVNEQAANGRNFDFYFSKVVLAIYLFQPEKRPSRNLSLKPMEKLPLSLLVQGRRQKIFQDKGNEKQDQKLAKNIEKWHYLPLPGRPTE